MKKQEITLAQSNLLTQARYDYTKVEKRAVYLIIQEVRRQFVINRNGQKDLFNDLIINMTTSALKKTDSELRDIYKSLRNLRKKDIYLEDDEQVLCVGYINYFKHKKGTENLEVQISHTILPYLVELAEHFTSYSLTVALALKNKYSQRFYEYCSQWKSTGFMVMKVEELRKQMMLEDKYPRYALLRQYVLNPAQKELKELYDKGECDLYFTYTEEKYGRQVDRFHFIIHTREIDEETQNLKPEDYLFYVKNWLNTWLYAIKRPKNKKWIENVVSHLQLHPNKIEPLYIRLAKMVQNEPNSNHAALARHIIEEDFLQDEDEPVKDNEQEAEKLLNKAARMIKKI